MPQHVSHDIRRASFTIGDLDVIARCECGQSFRRDSATDAFSAWWAHAWGAAL